MPSERTAVRVADEYGTPVRVLDLDQLDDRFDSFRTAWTDRFERVAVGYSFKTNPLGAVTRALRRRGALAEVVSGMELRWALSDGYDDGRIVFNGPVKRPEELALAARRDALVNVDDAAEVATIGDALPEGTRARVGVRIRAAVEGHDWSRFGVAPEAAPDVIERIAADPDLVPAGVHFHVGTNVERPGAYEEAVEGIRPALETLYEHTAPGECVVDVGGGYPVACSRPAEADEWEPPGPDRFAEAVARGLGDLPDPPPTVLPEPGRVLVEPCGALVCEVVRRTTVDGSDALVVDAGSNVVPSASVYERDLTVAPDREGEAATYDVYGPLCMQSDRLGTGVSGPATVEPGDRVIVHGVGGYDVPGAYSWIRPRPPIVGTRGSRSAIVRSGDTPAEVRAPEQPDALAGSAPGNREQDREPPWSREEP